MKKYVQWSLPLVLLVAGVFILAHSQGMPMHRGRGFGGPGFGGPGMFMERWGRNLNLTDAQKTQVKSLHDQQRTALEPLMKQLASLRKDMLTATANGAFDQAKVTQLANQQAQIEAQLTVAHEQLQSKIYNTVLTSDQKTEVDQMRQKRLRHLDQMIQNGPPAPKQ